MEIYHPPVESVSSIEKAPIADDVSSFLWKLWHPVQHEPTLEQRDLAIPSIEKGLAEFGIEKDSYVAMVHGSLQWITNNSDNDFRLIRLDEGKDAEEQFLEARKFLKTNYNTDIYFGSQTVDQTALFETDHSHGMKRLLLTPDEYIAGNLEVARELRLQAFTQIADNPTLINTHWDGKDAFNYKTGHGAQGKIESYFRYQMKEWPLISEDEYDKKRTHRMQDFLGLPRSHSIPRDTLPLFDLYIPEFATYYEELKNHSGELQMKRHETHQANTPVEIPIYSA